MRVECAWCKKDLGEKCPNCGCGSFLFKDREVKTAECLNCDQIFQIGQASASSTICPECRAKNFLNLPGRLTVEDVLDRATVQEGLFFVMLTSSQRIALIDILIDHTTANKTTRVSDFLRLLDEAEWFSKEQLQKIMQ
jgi:hypothetical protein